MGGSSSQNTPRTGRWGQVQTGSDGFDWILPFHPVGVRLAPLEARDFKGFSTGCYPDYTESG